jgi:predicted flap endonuclease-1-like 5' DNA nuclease
MQDLPFTTPTQIAALVLTLIAGWLFGLASASGGRRWRERYQDEVLTRGRAEAELKEANRRIRELEAERDRLPAAVPATPAVAVAATEGTPGWRGWFGWGRDNLSRIRGIDEARERQLNDLGVKTYAGLEDMSTDEEVSLETRLGLASGTIAREDWREQAALLRAGGEDEHARRYP